MVELIIGLNIATLKKALSLPSIVFIKDCPVTLTNPSVVFTNLYPKPIVLTFLPLGSIKVPLLTKVALLTF